MLEKMITERPYQKKLKDLQDLIRILKDNSDNEEEKTWTYWKGHSYLQIEYVYEELCSMKIRLTCLGNFRSIEEKRKF